MFLGIDIGTSAVKAVLIDEDGKPAGESSIPLSISRPKSLWSEQNPADWWSATNMAVAQLDLELRKRIECIGLTGQMHGAVVLDHTDQPLRPAILWNDGRSHKECEDLIRTTPEFLSTAGNLVMPGFTAPKIAWMRNHERGNFQKIAKILLPKDYVRLRMTGEYATDMSDAAGTLWLDVAARDWSDTLLSACGISKENMPKLYEGHEVTGTLRAEAAEAWGCPQVPVIAGGSDNAAGAAGVGVVHDGEALLSLGTSGVVFVASDLFRPHTDGAVHAFCHALPEKWHLMSVMLSAASCLEWAVGITKTTDASTLVDLSEQSGQFGGPEQFLPYLSGERTPHNNPYAKGVLFGMNFETDAARIGQAVMEGVAFGLTDGLDAILASGTDIKSISVIGGGSRSLYWGRILAAAMNRPLIYRDGAATGPAFGAARLARFGVQRGEWDEVFAHPTVVDIIEPRDADVNRLAPKLAQFRTLYRCLESEFNTGNLL